MKLFRVAGSISALVAVAAGAFGAHGLREHLDEGALATFETAARYQMYHALALLAIGWALSWAENAALTAAGWLFIAGTVLFSGSLYLLALTGVRWLGAITPLGGLAFLVGWGLMAWGSWREGSSR
jgi:uncharacterized membrane protein YgdD (TMEM256/DUF423 family)